MVMNCALGVAECRVLEYALHAMLSRSALYAMRWKLRAMCQRRQQQPRQHAAVAVGRNGGACAGKRSPRVRPAPGHNRGRGTGARGGYGYGRGRDHGRSREAVPVAPEHARRRPWHPSQWPRCKPRRSDRRRLGCLQLPRPKPRRRTPGTLSDHPSTCRSESLSHPSIAGSDIPIGTGTVWLHFRKLLK